MRRNSKFSIFLVYSNSIHLDWKKTEKFESSRWSLLCTYTLKHTCHTLCLSLLLLSMTISLPLTLYFLCIHFCLWRYVNLDVTRVATVAHQSTSYDGKLLMLEGWLELYLSARLYLSLGDCLYECACVRNTSYILNTGNTYKWVFDGKNCTHAHSIQRGPSTILHMIERKKALVAATER